MIYRITERATWDAAQALGFFASADLAAEGFIHCCTVEQLHGVVERYYQGQRDLMVLEIDAAKLDIPLRWEDLQQTGELFPHVYGRIPLAAVIRCRALRPEAH